jgi:hypothetical protein
MMIRGRRMRQPARGKSMDEEVEGIEHPVPEDDDDVAIRRRRALARLGKIAVYSTPLVIGLLSSDAWSESG